jgi:hypothetical protein
MEGSTHGLMKLLSWHLPGETEENQQKTSIIISGVPAEILIEHLPNTNLEEQYW